MYTPIKALKFYKRRYGRLFDTLDKIFQGKIPTDDEWDKNLMCRWQSFLKSGIKQIYP